MEPRQQLNALYPGYDKKISELSDESVNYSTDRELALRDPRGWLKHRYSPYSEQTSEDLMQTGLDYVKPYFNKGVSYLSRYRDGITNGSALNAIGNGAGGGAALGAAGGLLYSILGGGESALKNIAGGAAIGGGLGGLSGLGINRTFQKTASSADIGYIQQKIMSEPDYSQAEKAKLIKSIQSLPESKISELSRLLKTAFGASVGIILSRFLGLGVASTIAMSVGSGMIGNSTGKRYIVDAMGRKKELN